MKTHARLQSGCISSRLNPTWLPNVIASLSVESRLWQCPVDPVNVWQLTSVINADLCRDDRVELGVHRKHKVAVFILIRSEIRHFIRVVHAIVQLEIVVRIEFVKVGRLVMLGR